MNSQWDAKVAGCKPNVNASYKSALCWVRVRHAEQRHTASD